jgi:superfamily II DNA or RNA helicase
VTDYLSFVGAKRITDPFHGFEPAPVHSRLFPHQADITRWAIERGRAAIFADTGLGKTAMQLEWARQVAEHADGRVLILAPLAVGAQTAAEGVLLDVPVTVCRTAADLPERGVAITNYERLHHFEGETFAGVVLDESSILKAFSGKTRQAIQAFASRIPHRLACTATPAPNDVLELTNHSEFVGALPGKMILSIFMCPDDRGLSRSYRVKRPAQRAWEDFVSSWAFAIRRPSEIGYSDDGYALPPLTVVDHEVGSADLIGTDDRLFALQAGFGLRERQAARRASVQLRAEKIAELVAAEPDEQWLVWCDLNDESAALARLIPDAQEVRGADTPEDKEDRLTAFRVGELRVLVTKPSIAGWGLNFQRCARVAFCGLSDSFEAYHQAVRRTWRYGQAREVSVHRVTSIAERAVRDNIDRKRQEHDEMMDAFIDARGRLATGRNAAKEVAYEPETPIVLPEWLAAA